MSTDPPPRLAAATARVRRKSRRAVVAGGVAVACGIAAPLPAHAQPTDGTTTVPPTTAPPTTPPPPPPSTTTTTTTPRTTTTPPTTTPRSTTTAPPVTTAPPIAPKPTTPVEAATTTTTTTTPPAPAEPAGPVAPPQLRIVVYPEQIESILATIRHLESRDNYLAPPNAGNASGAYQFIRSTWNNYGGYEHAYLAPPSVQDARAALDVSRFLAQFNNDVSMIPVMWYYPIAASQPEWMDRVPGPQFGNRLTIREYQTLWLRNFARISGTVITPRVDVSPTSIRTLVPGAPPELPVWEGERALSFPVLGPSNLILPECDSDVLLRDAASVQVATPSDASWVAVTSFADIQDAGRCAKQTPGVITGTQLQPVLAVSDGVVTEIHDEPGSGEPISITLTDPSGMSFIYSGFNDDTPGTDDGNAPEHLRLSGLAEVGNTVRAGQLIGFMGNSAALPSGLHDGTTADDAAVDPVEDTADDPAVDDAEDTAVDVVTPPNVQVRSIDVNGEAVDTYGPIVDAMFRQTCQVMIGPWSGPAHGEGHEPVLVAAPDRVDDVDSGWMITETGQAIASGWGAMVNPTDACTNTPTETFGPGAAGVDQGLLHWLAPIDLPTETWVAISMHDDPDTRGVVLR